ncbi:hypothetical protein PHLCEN_2v1922 [Hermanssonia centrifuga]|uniref:Uncharacterized protein n=1 Tax=Hermanssonia centrifuga TaxID=98765 RepID=A0A2R6RVG5_9APHY|nr:hypothetical protein PHLCEN_2v1922 [Hermanssonia centrifuga]
MSEPVQGVEGKGRGEDRLASVFDSVGETSNKLDHIYRGEGLRGSEIRDGIPVQHCAEDHQRC